MKTPTDMFVLGSLLGLAMTTPAYLAPAADAARPVGAAKKGQAEMQEGTIAVTGGSVRFRAVGLGKPGVPLVIVHGGGPNNGSMSLELAAVLDPLADERPVIFYSQTGGGAVDRLKRTPPRIADYAVELGEVCAALAYPRVHLFGHSWGTRVVTDYLLTQPHGVAGVVLCGPTLSESQQKTDRELLVAQLPPEVRSVIKQHEAAGTTDRPDYKAAVSEFDRRHFNRANQPSIAKLPPPSNGLVALRRAMQDEIDHYERVDRLREIHARTLFMCGEFDLCTPGAATLYQSNLPGAKLTVVSGAAHFPMLEQPAAFFAALREFLRSAETAKGT